MFIIFMRCVVFTVPIYIYIYMLKLDETNLGRVGVELLFYRGQHVML